MIDPAALRIPGGMAALRGHADAVSGVGADFADTASRVHSTWQGLAPVYRAPEAGQLFAATAPVQSIAAAVGADMTAVGGALGAFADEVEALQARMDALRAEAEAFLAGPGAAEDWRSSSEDVDHHNRMLGAANAIMAEYMDAQRRCANTVLGLYSDVRYAAENGDGTIAANEFGYSRELLDAAVAQGEALPWGAPEEHDRGLLGDTGAFFVGIGTGAKDAFLGLGGLVGYGGGEWSWANAGTAWKGLGTFALALSPIALTLNAFTDLPGLPKGTLHNTLLAAGKGLIAYDTWGEDKSKAAGMVTFNVVSAIVGTKGAGAALRGGGAAAQASKVGLVAKVGSGAVRAGEFIGKLPSVTDVAGGALRRLPGFRVPDVTIPDIDVPPDRVDAPRVDPPRPPGIDRPSVGDALGDPRPRPDAPAVPGRPEVLWPPPELAGRAAPDGPPARPGAEDFPRHPPAVTDRATPDGPPARYDNPLRGIGVPDSLRGRLGSADPPPRLGLDDVPGDRADFGAPPDRGPGAAGGPDRTSIDAPDRGGLDTPDTPDRPDTPARPDAPPDLDRPGADTPEGTDAADGADAADPARPDGPGDAPPDAPGAVEPPDRPDQPATGDLDDPAAPRTADEMWADPPWVREGRAPSIGELIPRSDDEFTRHGDALREALADRLAGRDFAGLEVRLQADNPIDTHSGYYDRLTVRFDVVDPQTGHTVGSSSRLFLREEDGTLVVDTNSVRLNEAYQGRGFSASFDRYLEDWYRESGVSHIQLHAAWDTGGYAWARAGYDWAPDTAHRARPTFDRLRAELASTQRDLDVLRTGNPVDLAALESRYGVQGRDALLDRMQTDLASAGEVREVLDRAARIDWYQPARGHSFPNPGYPTPLDITRLGEGGPPGNWLGKRAMLGSNWNGVKVISDGGPVNPGPGR